MSSWTKYSSHNKGSWKKNWVRLNFSKGQLWEREIVSHRVTFSRLFKIAFFFKLNFFLFHVVEFFFPSLFPFPFPFSLFFSLSSHPRRKVSALEVYSSFLLWSRLPLGGGEVEFGAGRTSKWNTWGRDSTLFAQTPMTSALYCPSTEIGLIFSMHRKSACTKDPTSISLSLINTSQNLRLNETAYG